MRISDWSSDVCSSDLVRQARGEEVGHGAAPAETHRAEPAVAALDLAQETGGGEEVLAHLVLVELAEQRARRVLVAGVAAEWEQRVGRERNESLQRQSPRDVFDVRIEAAILVRDQYQRQRSAGLGGFDQVAARGAVALGRCELDVPGRRSEQH